MEKVYRNQVAKNNSMKYMYMRELLKQKTFAEVQFLEENMLDSKNFSQTLKEYARLAPATLPASSTTSPTSIPFKIKVDSEKDTLHHELSHLSSKKEQVANTAADYTATSLGKENTEILVNGQMPEDINQGSDSLGKTSNASEIRDAWDQQSKNDTVSINMGMDGKSQSKSSKFEFYPVQSSRDLNLVGCSLYRLLYCRYCISLSS